MVFGILLAMNLLILFLCGILCDHYNVSVTRTYELYIVFPAFRSFSFFIIYIWLLGLNVKVWNQYNINYKEIFKFNDHCSEVNKIFSRAGFFTMIWSLCFLTCIINVTIYEPPVNIFLCNSTMALYPWIFFILYLLYPSKS